MFYFFPFSEPEKKNKLAKGCTTPEILAVLGHELGHWKLNHVLKNIVIAEGHIFAMFALFGYLYQHQLLYTAFGFENVPGGQREKSTLLNYIYLKLCENVF